MIRRDMLEVLAIEKEAFEFPWSEDDFARCLRQRNCIGMVAEMSDSIVAFTVYELHRSRLHVLNFAVLRSHRRLGVGTQMMAKLTAKLAPDRRNRIVLEVRAVSVLRDFYQDSAEDAYLMQLCLTADAAAALPERRLAG
jgi:ribosomal-protein-alanine N-acetyltransferase